METERINYVGMIVIHGDLFKLDKARKTLIEYGNDANKQPMEALNDAYGSIEAWYDTSTKRFFKNDFLKNNVYQGSSFKRIFIPEVAAYGYRMLPSGMSFSNMLSRQGKHGYHFVDQELSDRLNGDIPTISYEGIRYKVDIEQQEIRQAAAPQIKFVFGYDDLFEPSEMYYNTAAKTPATIEPDIVEFPKDVVCLKFPRLSELDIVGYTKMSGLNPTALVCNLEWRADPSKIQMVDLLQTKVPEMIFRNQTDKELKNDKNIAQEKDIKTSRRRGLGRR